MSILGGYDLALEISAQALLMLARVHGAIQGQSLGGNFEIASTGTLGPFAIEGHFLCSGLEAARLHQETNQLGLWTRFSRSSITLSGAGIPPSAVTSLAGQFEITAPIGLTSTPLFDTTHQASNVSLMLELNQASAHVDFDGPSENRLLTALQPLADVIGLHPDVAFIESQASQGMESYLHQQRPMTLQGIQSFRVVPGVNGGIAPLQFEQLDTVRCFDSQTLVLFGNLLPDHHGAGDPDSKDERGLASVDYLDWSLSCAVGAEAVQRLVLCPRMAEQALNRQVAGQWEELLADGPSADRPERAQTLIRQRMPACCGTASELPFDADGTMMRVEELCDTWTNGAIRLTSRFSNVDQDLARVTVSMSHLITGHASGQSVSFASEIEHVFPEVVPHGWGVVADIFTGGIFRSILAALAGLTAAMTTPAGRVSIPLGSVTDAEWNGVRISPEGVLFQGVLNPPESLTTPSDDPHVVVLIENYEMLDAAERTPGQYIYQREWPTSDGGVYRCGPRAIRYESWFQSEKTSFRVEPRLIASPNTVEYWIESYDFGDYFSDAGPHQRIRLEGDHGEISIDAMNHFVEPMPDGTTVYQQVLVEYAIDGRVITTTVRKPFGNVFLNLYVRVTDPDGNSYVNRPTSLVNVYGQDHYGISFLGGEGNPVELNEEDEKYINTCEEGAPKPQLPVGLPPFDLEQPVPVPRDGDPSPFRLPSLVQRILQQGQLPPSMPIRSPLAMRILLGADIGPLLTAWHDVAVDRAIREIRRGGR